MATAVHAVSLAHKRSTWLRWMLTRSGQATGASSRLGETATLCTQAPDVAANGAVAETSVSGHPLGQGRRSVEERRRNRARRAPQVARRHLHMGPDGFHQRLEHRPLRVRQRTIYPARDVGRLRAMTLVRALTEPG